MVMNRGGPFPNHIVLILENKKWIQLLDYEYITFHYRSCMQIGHLYGLCSLSHPSKKKNSKPKVKRWNNPNLSYSSYSSDDEVE